MKKTVRLIRLFSLLILLNLFAMPKYKAEAQTLPEFGLNYQARSDFDPNQLTDAAMKEDLDLFESQNIRHLTIIAHWNSFEPTMSQYSTTYLNRLIRFIDYANSRGFKVSMDTHCHMLGNGAPSWTDNYGNGQHDMTNVFNEPVRTHWLNLHEWLSQHIGDKLYSLQAWNEPYLSGDAQNPDDFIDLFQETKDAWRTHSTSLFTIRTAIYGLHQFWDYDQFYDICDYISINIYPNRYSGHTYERLKTAITKIEQHEKEWSFGEYGYDSWDDQTQYNGLENSIAETASQLQGYQKTQRTIIWIWLRASSGGQWSLCDTGGKPRLAFSLLQNGELPPEPPPNNNVLPHSTDSPQNGTVEIPPYNFPIPESLTHDFSMEIFMFIAVIILVVFAFKKTGGT